MKKFKQVIIALMLVLGVSVGNIATFTSINQVTVCATNLGGTMNSITNSKTQVIGTETKTKITGLANNVQELVLIVVLAVLMINALITSVKFLGVGDDPSKKAKLKQNLIYLVCGIAFLASIYGFIKFGFTNLKLFN